MANGKTPRVPKVPGMPKAAGPMAPRTPRMGIAIGIKPVKVSTPKAPRIKP